MDMGDRCISCDEVVRPRQHGVSCDLCDRWQHRTCGTGITREQYYGAIKGQSLSFTCVNCSVPRHNSSLLELSHGDTLAEHSLHTEIPPELPSLSGVDIVSDFSNIERAADLSLDVSDHDTPDPTNDNDSNDRSMDSVRLSISFEQPDNPLERSLQDPPLPTNQLVEEPVTYNVIPNGSQKQKDLLVDSLGYSFVIKDKSSKSTRWRCSVRNKSLSCGAMVIQKGDVFTRNNLNHLHPPDVTKKVSTLAITEARPAGISYPYASARTLVTASITNIDEETVEPVKVDNLVRRVNRARQRQRPEEPTDMDFELYTDHLPSDFLKKDMRVDDRRHLIFATDAQLELLEQAKTWYMDGTFKAVRKPFEMLFTIHAFVRRGTAAKQVPLMYVLMTGSRTKDYAKVLKKIQRSVRPDDLEQIVIDFEAALWKACREVFPEVRLQGCGFHWGQAVFRHVQSLGLTTEYLSHTGTYSFIRQLLCLPLLPAEHIQPTFQAMRAFNTADHIEPLLDYIERTWMRSTLWPVPCWSVYGRLIRTNNDVEGWHRRLNGKTGTAPPFYILVKTLFNESREVDDEIQLVSENATRKLKRKNYAQIHKKLLAAWRDYRDGLLTATGLLKRCSTFYKPAVIEEQQEEDPTE